jgi:hypothetical protein
MKQLNDKDFYEFKKYHKNKYNRIIHIFSFLIGFLAFIFIFKNKYIKYAIILLYISLIYFTYYNIIIITNISIILLIIFCIFKYLNITSTFTLVVIILITYM